MQFTVTFIGKYNPIVVRPDEPLPNCTGKIFRSPEDLAAEFSLQEMDDVLTKLLKHATRPSTTAEVASIRLWTTILANKDDSFIYGPTAAVDTFGNVNRQSCREVELIELVWRPGGDSPKDRVIQGLKPFLLRAIKLFLDDGRGVWDHEEWSKIMYDGWRVVSPTMPYHQRAKQVYHLLANRGVFRRLSYVEYAARGVGNDA